MEAPIFFTTERLKIRRWKLSDAKDMYDTYASKEERVRFISWKAHQNIDDSKVFLELCRQNFDSGKDYAYAIILKESDKLIGSIGMVNEGGRVFIGYILGKEFEGKGYTTEAVKCLIDFLVKQQDVFRIWACCAVENKGSARVLEKVGMQLEATIKDWVVFPNMNNESRDCYFFYYPKNK